MANIKELKRLYNLAKSARVGETVICPSCGTSFIKSNYQQAFCKTKSKTECKDYYWNNVTLNKRNNKTRISPASRSWNLYCDVAPSIYGSSGRISGYTEEGYRIMDGVAYDEFDSPVYDI